MYIGINGNNKKNIVVNTLTKHIYQWINVNAHIYVAIIKHTMKLFS